MGREFLVFDDQERLLEHQFLAPAVDQVLAVDDFDYGPGGTASRQTIVSVR